jgi:hypothetical protein
MLSVRNVLRQRQRWRRHSRGDVDQHHPPDDTPPPQDWLLQLDWRACIDIQTVGVNPLELVCVGIRSKVHAHHLRDPQSKHAGAIMCDAH